MLLRVACRRERTWAPRALLCCLTIAACASTYSGQGVESLAPEQIGILEHDDPVNGGIVIEEVDGHWRGVGMMTRYRLTPGPHSLGVKVNLAFYSSDRVVRWLAVKPGKVYSIQAATDAGALRWGFWIVDKATGERVDSETRPP